MSGRDGVTWLGHSTVLIELGGVRLLTDPLLRRRVLHLRRREPAPAIDPPPDAILVSHAHWDHLHLSSLDLLPRSAVVVVPTGAGRAVRRRGFGQVVELSAGGSVPLDGVVVRATAAEHRVDRWPRGIAAPALGFIVDGGRTVYFAGDTDLFEGMRELGPIDVVLLPVAGWGPRLPPGHLDPRRAAEALQLLRPRIAIPIHFGTYAPARSQQWWTSAPDEFRRHAAELAPDVEVRVLGLGEHTDL